ncbi:MAG: zinc ribbon domain-containing protein [Dehalococcoidales bacterium]|nr:zinc ribbon domain-containing protein [Dehalococcoidales bacterium]
MPVYEFKCRKCGEKFELKLGFFHNRRNVTCPKCGENAPDRVFSSFGIDTGSSCSTGSTG